MQYVDADEQAERGEQAEPLESQDSANDVPKKKNKDQIGGLMGQIIEMTVNGDDLDSWLELPQSVRDFRGGNHSSTADDSPLPSVATLMGNHPGATNLPSTYENQCAIKLSYALQLSGVDMSSYFRNGNASEVIKVNGRKYRVALRAYELWDWLSSSYANGNWDGPGFYSTTWYSKQEGAVNVADYLKNNTGIVVFYDFWGSGQGHIDIWDGQRLGDGVVYGPNSYFDRASKIIILSLSAEKRPRD